MKTGAYIPALSAPRADKPKNTGMAMWKVVRFLIVIAKILAQKYGYLVHLQHTAGGASF